MRTQTRNVYTLAELQTAHPEAFARVLERWGDIVRSNSPAWSEETMASLKAVIKACGGTLRDWSIGVDSGTVDVDAEDEYETDAGRIVRKGPAWMRRLLDSLGYTGRGRKRFSGLCKFTGYCADDDFLEHVYIQIMRGDTLTDALESLGPKASELMAADMEQAADAETMLANWGEQEYDESGDEVK